MQTHAQPIVDGVTAYGICHWVLSACAAVLAVVALSGCARNPGTAPDAPSPTISAPAEVSNVPPAVTAPAPGAAKASPAAPPAPSAAKPAASSPVAIAKPAPLNLASLESRLRDTKAIGVLTKITLKNQVDDLLDQFRTYYAGKLKIDLAQLRKAYDLLVLKFVALLQDDDKALANAIVASREDIWGILSDRTKFATI